MWSAWPSNTYFTVRSAGGRVNAEWRGRGAACCAAIDGKTWPRSVRIGRGLSAAGGNRRAFCLIRINIDETDVEVRESLTTFHVNCIGNDALAVSEIGTIATAEGAGNFDVLDRVVVFVAQRKGDQGIRPQSAAAPGLRRNPQACHRRSSDRGYLRGRNLGRFRLRDRSR